MMTVCAMIVGCAGIAGDAAADQGLGFRVAIGLGLGRLSELAEQVLDGAAVVLVHELDLLSVLFFALAGQAQQQLEDVDEVQVERQRAHHRQLLVRLGIMMLGVLLLDRLRVPGRQADEDEDADDRDGELQSPTSPGRC